MHPAGRAAEDWAIKPHERRETGEMDLFRSRRGQIINMNHELVRLAKTVSSEAIEARCGEVHSDGRGMPPLPTRLMAELPILKHTLMAPVRKWRIGADTTAGSAKTSRFSCTNLVTRPARHR